MICHRTFFWTAVVTVFLLTGLPHLSFSECTLTAEYAGGYGTHTYTFKDKDECESERSSALYKLSQMGGGGTISDCNCTPEPEAKAPSEAVHEADAAQKEAERKAEELKNIKNREIFLKTKDEAVRSLKGNSFDASELKGMPSGQPSGLKGISSALSKLKEALEPDRQSSPKVTTTTAPLLTRGSELSVSGQIDWQAARLKQHRLDELDRLGLHRSAQENEEFKRLEVEVHNLWVRTMSVYNLTTDERQRLRVMFYADQTVPVTWSYADYMKRLKATLPDPRKDTSAQNYWITKQMAQKKASLDKLLTSRFSLWTSVPLIAASDLMYRVLYDYMQKTLEEIEESIEIEP